MNITSIAIAVATVIFVSVGIFIFNQDTVVAPPVDGVACTMEALECPDGSYVGRSGPNCEFAACPTLPVPPAAEIPAPDTPVSSGDEDTVMCTMDARQCSDGSFVGRVAPGCAFAACPDGSQPLDPVVIGGTETTCTPDSRTVDACIEIFAPVCASVQEPRRAHS